MQKKKYFFCILGVLRVLVSYEKTQPGYQLIQYITHMIVIVYYHYYFLMCLETYYVNKTLNNILFSHKNILIYS